MIYWQGKRYVLNPNQYNGKVFGYLWEGILVDTPPRNSIIKGHIVTDNGVIIVLRRDIRLPLILALVIVLMLSVMLWPRHELVYYQVTFSERPVLSEGVLYCNIINEADIQVTVQFLNSFSKSMVYTLNPGDTLPYIYIDFVPEVIRYNGNSDFPLEVRSD